MDIYEIKQRYSDHYYDVERPTLRKYEPGHVFDEDKSVKWNREKLVEYNEGVNRQMREYLDQCYAKDTEFKGDVCQYLVEAYEVSHAQAELIQAYVWEEHHSCMSEYFDYIDDVAEVVRNILNTSN